MASNEVRIRVTADTGDASNQLSNLSTNTSKLNGNLTSSLKKFGLMGAAVTGAAVGIGLATTKIFDMASNLELVQNKINIVFGEQVSMVTDWADNVSERMGLSSTQVAGLAANFADLLIPMQFTREEAASMSTDIVGLSGALAEWSGGTRSASEVSEILGKAMLGEREAIKSLGISITEADVKNKILSMSTEELTGMTEAQAKAIATRDLILEKSVDAQNAYAENTDGLSVAQAALSSSLANLKDTVITALTPALRQFAEFLKDTVVPAIRDQLIPAIEDIDFEVLAIDLEIIMLKFERFKKLLTFQFFDSAKIKTEILALEQEKLAIQTEKANEKLKVLADSFLEIARASDDELIPTLVDQRQMLDEANQGYFDFSDAALGVKSNIISVTDALTAQQLALKLINEGFFELDQTAQNTTMQLVADSFRRASAMEQETSRVAALVDSLAKAIRGEAGLDIPFVGAFPGSTGQRGGKNQTATKQGVLIPINFNDAQVKTEIQEFQKLAADQFEEGFLRIGIDLDKLFGKDEFNPASGFGTIGGRFGGENALVDAFRNIAGQGPGIGNRGAVALARTIADQAIQQKFEINITVSDVNDPVAIGDRILELLQQSSQAQATPVNTVFGAAQ